MGLVLSSAPALEPIALSDAKIYLRVDDTADDTLISVLIKAARQYAEEEGRIALISQTWDWWLDTWPLDRRNPSRGLWWDGVRDGAISLLHPTARSIDLPKSPVQSITDIRTFAAFSDVTGSVWDASNYTLDVYSSPSRITAVSGAGWQTSSLRSANAIRVRFVAGFGTTGDAVPADLIQGMNQLIAHWYENRGEQADVPAGIRDMFRRRGGVRI